MVLRPMSSARVRISIVSRSDSDFISSENTGVCEQVIVNVDDQPLDLKLFNRTGEGVSGYHYDPITVLSDSNAVRVRSVCRQLVRNKHWSQSGAALALLGDLPTLCRIQMSILVLNKR